MNLPARPLNPDVIGRLRPLKTSRVIVVMHRIDRLERVRDRIPVRPTRMPLIAPQRHPMRRQSRNRRRARRDIRNLVGQTDRPLRDHIDLIADLHILPVTRDRTTRPLGEHIGLDPLDLLISPRMRDLHLTRLRATLSRRALKPHPRANKRRDQLITLIAVLLTQIILDPPTRETARIRTVKPIKKHARRDPIPLPNRPMERQLRLRVKTPQPTPPHLNRTQTTKNKTRRRDHPPMRRTRRISTIRPQRIVIPNPLREPQNRMPHRILVIHRLLRPQLSPDQSPHLSKHLIRKPTPGKLLRNPSRLFSSRRQLSPSFLITNC